MFIVRGSNDLSSNIWRRGWFILVNSISIIYIEYFDFPTFRLRIKRLPIVNLFLLLCFGNKKKGLTIGNLLTIMIRRTIKLTFKLVTLNVVPNIYILGKSKYSIRATLMFVSRMRSNQQVPHLRTFFPQGQVPTNKFI